jgi:osmotically-inducible protein OsmY
MKKTPGILCATLVVFPAFIGLSACRTTQSPRRRVNDTGVKACVKAKLAEDVRLSTLTNIEVNSTNGVVTLAGQVHNKDEKNFAEDVARKCDDVVKVNNELQVEQPQER